MNREDLKMKIREICNEALRIDTPNEKEKHETLQFSENLAGRLERELKKAGLEVQAQVEGSIAKDTWLRGEKDIDIFMLVPKSYGREAFDKALNVAKRVAGKNYLEAYAEHPYIQAKIEGITVDFVPCFRVERAEEVASSVDRTPLHTAYVKSKINAETKNEVRLLKRFLRGAGTYGAEIRVGGFSGYLCEVLTLYYGLFLVLLNAASDWREGEVIDLEGYYKDSEDEAREIFQEPLIVVDPIDKGRNVASAVRVDRLNEFIAVSRGFLNIPALHFFYPKQVESLSVYKLARTMNLRRSTMIFLKTDTMRTVPDVLWGQLFRSQKALKNMISQDGFIVLRDDVWSDGKTTSIFVFELNSRYLPEVERHLGPPLEKRKDSERFLEKHLRSKRRLSGPRIQGDRWVVERRRKYTDITDLLVDKLKDGGENMGIASLFSNAFSSSFMIWVNREVKEFYSRNPSFASFFTQYLEGTPRWLQSMNHRNNQTRTEGDSNC
jgi:tRNA nucleotidyltransferase (CCA-adding enzyme)